MSRRTTLAAGLALPAAAIPFAAHATVAPGTQAPDFTLPDQDGTARSLSALRGRTVVIQWENFECPFVRKHYTSSNMQNLQREAAAKGITWISMASSPEGEQGHVTGARARELTASRQAAPAFVLLDHRSVAARAYGATVTPQIIVIDAQGIIRYNGAIDSIRSTRVEDVARAETWAKDAMIAVSEGRAPARASTPPYGCAIKYIDA
ncbi:redoxin family protein [Rhodovarius crocodyli]|nr:redoxin family protein [Rhodovarius crocodyli]